MSPLSDLPVTTLDGRPSSFRELAGGKAALVVNVASRCGLTPQYEGLERLQQRYSDRGFTVLGVPCNQFGGQEPGSSAEIAQFCSANYGVSFPLTEKVEVNGDGASPLYDWMKAEAPGLMGSRSVKWNFTKFLIGRDGKVVRRYGPTDAPAAIEKDIAKLL